MKFYNSSMVTFPLRLRSMTCTQEAISVAVGWKLLFMARQQSTNHFATSIVSQMPSPFPSQVSIIFLSEGRATLLDSCIPPQRRVRHFRYRCNWFPFGCWRRKLGIERSWCWKEIQNSFKNNTQIFIFKNIQVLWDWERRRQKIIEQDQCQSQWQFIIFRLAGMNDQTYSQMETCENCFKSIPEEKMGTHFAYCRRNFKKCGVCDHMYDINDQSEHEAQYHSNEPCPHCSQKFKKSQIAAHMGSCSRKPKRCEYCDLEVPLEQYEEHFKACESRTNVCQRCMKSIQNKDYYQHISICQGIILDEEMLAVPEIRPQKRNYATQLFRTTPQQAQGRKRLKKNSPSTPKNILNEIEEHHSSQSPVVKKPQSKKRNVQVIEIDDDAEAQLLKKNQKKGQGIETTKPGQKGQEISSKEKEKSSAQKSKEKPKSDRPKRSRKRNEIDFK